MFIKERGPKGAHGRGARGKDEVGIRDGGLDRAEMPASARFKKATVRPSFS